MPRKGEIKGNRLDTTSYDYGIGWTSNTNQEFYFDLEDEAIIRQHTWCTCTDRFGYTRVETNIKIDGKYRRKSLAQVLTGENDIDHNDQNPFNNRRSNLRSADRSDQTANQHLKKNNTSGVTGVYYYPYRNRWIASLQKNKRTVLLKYYKNFDDAVKARLEAEIKYFGEFAPQKHLFSKYGIDDEQSVASEGGVCI